MCSPSFRNNLGSVPYWFSVLKKCDKLSKFYFSQQDEGFVKAEIIDYLEDFGFLVCWHHRDFTPGSFIAENIADATEHSRRIICVFSE